jgi:hypothetical protein
MAKQTSVNDADTYRVEVVKKLKVGALWLRPGQTATLKGSVINGAPDSVSVVEKVGG